MSDGTDPRHFDLARRPSAAELRARLVERDNQLEAANAKIAALTERAERAEARHDVSQKLANVFGDELCRIAGTKDRTRAYVFARDEFAAMKDRAERAKQKCEQYWNGPAVCEAELHAILEYIHKTLRGDLDARREAGRGA